MTKRTVLVLLAAAAFISGVLAYACSLPLIAVPMALIFAVFTPGLLILLGIRRHIVFSWTSIVFSAGLGVVFLLCVSLALNSIGRLLGNNVPLTLGNIMMAIAAGTVLLACLYGRWNERPFIYKKPGLQRSDAAIIAVATCTLLGFIIGALQLNNGGPGTVSFISFLLVPLLFGFVFWRAPKLHNGTIIYVLWASGLGILLSGWLRSVYVSGPDVSLEYRIAQMVQASGSWNIDDFKNAYNACLSVSLFVPVLSIIGKVGTAFTVKCIIPFLYSLVVPVVYLIAQKYLRARGASMAAFFFMIQPVFVVWWWIPVRQQVAFLLFGLIVLVLTRSWARERSGIVMLLILSGGLIVSHYSTAFLAILYFTLVWAIGRFVGKKDAQGKPPITLNIILILIVTYFAWYSQLTYGFNGITEFATKSITNIGQMFAEESQAQGQGLLAQFNVFSSQGQVAMTFSEYVKDQSTLVGEGYGEQNVYGADAGQVYQTSLISEDNGLAHSLIWARKVIIVLSKLVVIAGVIVVIVWSWRRWQLRTYGLLAAAALILVVGTIALPFFSMSYDQVRTYQQMLIVMGAVYALTWVLPNRFKTAGKTLLVLFVVVFFLLVSNILFYFTNSLHVPMNVANSGYEYNYRYAHATDVAAGHWLKDNRVSEGIVAGDGLARDKLRLVFAPNDSLAFRTTVIPSALPIKSYVISTHTNTNTNTAFDTIAGGMILYSYPGEFLISEKNTIYSNKQDIIYR